MQVLQTRNYVIKDRAGLFQKTVTPRFDLPEQFL